MSISPAGILIDVDGKMVDLAEVSWCHVAPCGCVDGVTIAYSDHFGTKYVRATAEDAEKEFSDSKAEQEKYRRLGYTTRAVVRAEAVELFRNPCEHDPKWGYSIPTPEGMAWAVGGYPHATSTRSRHLIDASNADAENGWQAPPIVSLCGRASKPRWTTETSSMWGLVECKPCLDKAVGA
jgi:hypothetical protein